MNILVVKTGLGTKKLATSLNPILTNNPHVITWNVDTEDVDNVLRVEADEVLTESDLMTTLKTYGVHCERLPD